MAPLWMQPSVEPLSLTSDKSSYSNMLCPIPIANRHQEGGRVGCISFGPSVSAIVPISRRRARRIQLCSVPSLLSRALSDGHVLARPMLPTGLGQRARWRPRGKGAIYRHAIALVQESIGSPGRRSRAAAACKAVASDDATAGKTAAVSHAKRVRMRGRRGISWYFAIIYEREGASLRLCCLLLRSL